MAFPTPKFTIDQVRAAGEVLIKPKPTSEERRDALDVLDNWRSIHAYPLQVAYKKLIRRARTVDSTAIVAQRRKRLKSIENKLIRLSRLKLHEIQDICGCRAIVETVDAVRTLALQYDRENRFARGRVPHVIKKDDYVSSPKRSGYRSVHYVIEFDSREPDLQCYAGLKIEIQIRSRLQHYWATAVETMSVFTGDDLKSSGAHERWIRFFVLMSGIFAMRENCPAVPGIPDSAAAIKSELLELVEELHVLKLMQACPITNELDVGTASKGGYFLLETDLIANTITVTHTAANFNTQGDFDLTFQEATYPDSSTKQTVLVSVDSIHNLKRAYPNYYLEITEFYDLVVEAIS